MSTDSALARAIAKAAEAADRIRGRSAGETGPAPVVDLRDRSNLDLLLDESISFDRAMAIISDRQQRGGRQ